MRKNFSESIVLLLVLLATAFTARADPQPKDEPQLGSLDWKPTPERPFGWRGDWTGRFPGATPPTQWSRRVSGATTDMKYQAKKPTGEPAADARPLEYFTVRDFLVLGPFSVADPVKDMDSDIIGGEATIEPDMGTITSGQTWKAVHASMDTQSLHLWNEGTCRHLNVDFVFLFGKYSESLPKKGEEYKGVQPEFTGDFTDKLAYAHSYIYSPAAGPARLLIAFTGTGCRAWVNGKPVLLDRNNTNGQAVDLVKGWNRLLLKVSCASGKEPMGQNAWVSRWLCAAYLMPSAPIVYETKNIAWMTPLTGRSMSQPIIVANNVYFGANMSDLVCVDKLTGKVRWLRSNTPWDTLSADEQSQYKEKMQPLVSKLAELNEQAVALINSFVSMMGMNGDQQEQLRVLLAAKSAAEKKIHDALATIDRRRFPRLYQNEASSSNATPVTDGHNVYWFCGGGHGTAAAYVFCAYALDGKRLWSAHDSTFGGAEHGTQSSPAYISGKLIYTINTTLLARDAATGKIVWQQEMPDKFNAQTPVIARVGGEPVIIGAFDWHFFSLFRVADGSKFAQSEAMFCGEQTPVIDNGVAYIADVARNFGIHNNAVLAVKLPRPGAAIAPMPALWQTDIAGGPNFCIASPLLVDGRLFNMNSGGCISAYETASGKELFYKWPDWYNHFDRGLYGAAASPTYAGKHIYVINDSGETLLLKPGDQYAEEGHNLLENINAVDVSGNPCKQEAFFTSPVFEGSRLYLRGEQYLYCIGKMP